MEMKFDGRSFDVTLFGVARLGEGSVEDVGPSLMPVSATDGLHLSWVLLLPPNVRPRFAGFLTR